MPHRVWTFIIILCLLLSGMTVQARSSAGESAAQAEPSTPELADLIARYRETIPRLMAEQKVSGLAIAIVDAEGVLWADVFGYTDSGRSRAITPDTPFSIQSMSKSFTATAVMMAVQDGLVDLDIPITQYLPEFHVNSIFEQHPEEKITLRRLLSHTAGFTHEAPVGSNYDLPGHTFEEHIASISRTWLMFPVGTRYNYSNLGIDLAGYILQVRSGKPFAQYLHEKVFQPLKMTHSSADFKQIRAWETRARGDLGQPIAPPGEWLIIPSGGVFASLNDMTRYVRFHINEGQLDGQALLRPELQETMLTPPSLPARAANYGLGLGVERINGARRIGHGGGGFGYLSEMMWYPELKLGVILLTNSSTHQFQLSLPVAILNEIIEKNPDTYTPRFLKHPGAEPLPLPNDNPEPVNNTQLQELIKTRADPSLTANPSSERYRQYAGTYSWLNWTFPSNQLDIDLASNDPSAPARLYVGIMQLYEVQPGLFFDRQGEAYDFRGPTPTYRNIPLAKLHPETASEQALFFKFSGLVCAALILLWPARWLLWKLRRSRVGQVDAITHNPAVERVSITETVNALEVVGGTERGRYTEPAADAGDPAIPHSIPALKSQSEPNLDYTQNNQRLMPGLIGALVLGALAGWTGLSILGAYAALPPLTEVPWPHAYDDLQLAFRLLFALPYLSAMLSAASLSLAWANRRSERHLPWVLISGLVVILIFNGVVLF